MEEYLTKILSLQSVRASHLQELNLLLTILQNNETGSNFIVKNDNNENMSRFRVKKFVFIYVVLAMFVFVDPLTRYSRLFLTNAFSAGLGSRSKNEMKSSRFLFMVKIGEK